MLVLLGRSRWAFSYERIALSSRVAEGAFMAPELEMMPLDLGIRSIRDADLPEDVLFGYQQDVVVDSSKDSPCPLCREMDFITVHIAFAEIKVVKRDVFCSCGVCASLEFSSEETRGIAVPGFRGRTDSRIDYEKRFLVRKFVQDLRQFIRLIFRLHLHLSKVDAIAGHVLSRHNDYHFSVGQYRSIIIDMIGHVANPCPWDAVEASGLRIHCASEDRRREKEILMFLVLFFGPSSFLVCPFRTIAVLMPVVAVATLERLAPVRNEPIVALAFRFAGPSLLPVDVLLSNFN